MFSDAEISQGSENLNQSRDRLWGAAFETYYDAYYNEILASKRASLWLRFDAFSRFLVALTASGSAVAGWALWEEPQFKIFWVLLAGLSAILAIAHSVLGASTKVDEMEKVGKHFALLRSDLETFRHQMAIFPDFAVHEFNEQLLAYRKRMTEGETLIASDIFVTRRLREAAQDEVNQTLEMPENGEK